MATVIVSPETFTMVFFDHDRIVELASQTADAVGLPADFEVRIEVDESSPLSRTRVVDLVAPDSGATGSVTLRLEGGAFEDTKRPRHLSEAAVLGALGRLLFRVSDRLQPGFAEAPADADLDLAQQTAWDTYAVGRCERAGLPAQKARRLYHFRNRHGFSDVADRAFERLWVGDGLTWADLDAVCAETSAARAATSSSGASS